MAKFFKKKIFLVLILKKRPLDVPKIYHRPLNGAQTKPNPMHPLRVTYHLYQAVIVLAQVDGHWPSDPAHPIHDIILAASNTLIWISKLLDKLLIKQNTTRVIASLKESKVDYTLLLYLQLPDPLRMKSEFISYLQSLCIQKNADFKSSLFYTCVWDYFEHEGVAPITPEKYIASNRKEDILKMYERAKKTWGKHSPLFLQTYDYDTKEGKFTNHLYHISRTAQDGILRLLDILKAGEFVVNGKLYTACGAIEHVVSLSTLSCQIYDCEIMSSVFDGRKSTEEIKEMVQCFPAYISSTMHKVGLINPETFITFEVKDRTRMTDPKTQNIKISYHFTPNICAPKYIHHKAAEICLREFKDRIDEAAVSIKSTGILPESLLSHDSSDSVYAFDCGAIKNGITTAFSRKKKSDAFSRLVYTEEVYEGCAIDRRECLKDPQDLQGDNLTVECRCMLVFKQLYTTPKKEMLCYAASAMEAFETESKETEKVYFNFFNFLIFFIAFTGIRTHTPLCSY